MENRIEHLILYNLIHNEEYTRKVIPFLKREYFSIKKERLLFEQIDSYFENYNMLPDTSSISVTVSQLGNITEMEEKELLELLDSISAGELQVNDNTQWLIDQTEKFCKDRAIHNALLESISIVEGDNKKLDKGAIPNILSDALSVGFDTTVGHDYIDDFESRFAFYHKKENKVPFDLESFNKITNGGVSSKTLSVMIAATGTGKSLAMCHMAAGNLSLGKNVLYITLEMAEERIAERIDANLLDTNISEFVDIPKPLYERKIEKLKENVTGRLIIKEYPTASANVNHFRTLLDELKIKKNFVPDIIYIDYLNIAASSRLKLGNSVNSYSYIKSIAEELRGLAVEYDLPIVSATQTNRNGFSNSDIDLGDTSESFGLPMTVDLMFALMSNEEYQEKGRYLVKQLKNRYVDPTFMRRFLIGVEYSKMRLYEVENPLEGLYENNDSNNVTQNQSSGNDSFMTGKNRRNKNFGNFDFGD